MNKPFVVQFEITGRDAGRLHSFYRNLFGWQLQDTPGYRADVAIAEDRERLFTAASPAGPLPARPTRPSLRM